MADGDITDEELAELVRRTEDAASAYMRGDTDRYLALTSHARGYTLRNLVQAHAWGDTVVLDASPRRPARPCHRPKAGGCARPRLIRSSSRRCFLRSFDLDRWESVGSIFP